MPRELGVIPAHFVEEPLGIVATDEHVNRLAERVIRTAPDVANHVDDHRGGHVTGRVTLLIQGKRATVLSKT